jgi:hypothetical protein
VIRRCKCQQLSKAWHVWAAHTSAHHVHTHTHLQLGLTVEKAECDKDEGNVSALPVSTPSTTTRSGPDAVVSLPPAQAPKGPPGRRTMKKLLQDIAASELRKVLEERKRQYACHICHKAYACSDTLAVHMRLDHTNTLASRSAARGSLPSTTLSSRHARHLGEEGEEWIPPVRQVIEGTSTTNAVCGGHCDALGSFFVCGGADKRVTVRSLCLNANLRLQYSIGCASAVTAIACSSLPHAKVLVYGLRSGDVVMRDLNTKSILPKQLPPRDRDSHRYTHNTHTHTRTHTHTHTHTNTRTITHTQDQRALALSRRKAALHKYREPDASVDLLPHTLSHQHTHDLRPSPRPPRPRCRQRV